MSEFIIMLGKQGPTDSTLFLNDKEYAIESDAWNLLSLIRATVDMNVQRNRSYQSLLEYVYNNFDRDLLDKPVETTNEQPKGKVYFIDVLEPIRTPYCPKCNTPIGIVSDADARSIMTYHCDICHYSE
jgi:hypothetical protein